MPSDLPSSAAPARSAAVVNDAIRALLAGRSGWTAAELDELVALQGEWLRARRAELVATA
ncbi:hypothetical protein ABZ883_14975 [Streptomyces sp. NPDC046977]|uniref:hypothetical protein n=1 Tax=Streptomyces sp. NPDC046977 TaxID=3154703 RepID=UPI0034008FDC